MKKFYKNQIRLIKEEDNNISPNQEYNNVVKQAKENPSGKASIPLNKLNNDPKDNGITIKGDGRDPNTFKTIQTAANNPQFQNSNVNVEITDGIKREGKLIESISFSKGELSSWLRSI